MLLHIFGFDLVGNVQKIEVDRLKLEEGSKRASFRTAIYLRIEKQFESMAC